MSVKSRNGSGNGSRLAKAMIYRILLGLASKESKWRETQGSASVKIRNGSDGLISTDHFTFYVHLYFRALLVGMCRQKPFPTEMRWALA